MNDTLSLSNNVEYVGDVDFSIYGRWIVQKKWMK
jgi:hypothetical protein